MPLNKFVPLSPDPYITSDPEMTLAKFGHLNTIVDYLNGVKAIGNLKLDGIINFNISPGGDPSVIITSTGQVNPLTFSLQQGATISIGTYYNQYLTDPLTTGYGNTFLGI